MKLRRSTAFLALCLAVSATIPATASTPSNDPVFPLDLESMSAPLADPDANKCFVTVENPHYSSGAGGVIAKVRWTCGSLASRTVTSFIGNLYRCPRKPAGTVEKTWTSTYGCSTVRSANGPVPFSVARSGAATRYIPRNGQTGASRGAYFVACVRGYYSSGTSFAKASNIVYVS